jgi:hypothetical protein
LDDALSTSFDGAAANKTQLMLQYGHFDKGTLSKWSYLQDIQFCQARVMKWPFPCAATIEMAISVR